MGSSLVGVTCIPTEGVREIARLLFLGEAAAVDWCCGCWVGSRRMFAGKCEASMSMHKKGDADE